MPQILKMLLAAFRLQRIVLANDTLIGHRKFQRRGTESPANSTGQQIPHASPGSRARCPRGAQIPGTVPNSKFTESALASPPKSIPEGFLEFALRNSASSIIPECSESDVSRTGKFLIPEEPQRANSYWKLLSAMNASRGAFKRIVRSAGGATRRYLGTKSEHRRVHFQTQPGFESQGGSDGMNGGARAHRPRELET